jgi:hypothetical protein
MVQLRYGWKRGLTARAAMSLFFIAITIFLKFSSVLVNCQGTMQVAANWEEMWTSPAPPGQCQKWEYSGFLHDGSMFNHNFRDLVRNKQLEPRHRHFMESERNIWAVDAVCRTRHQRHLRSIASQWTYQSVCANGLFPGYSFNGTGTIAMVGGKCPFVADGVVLGEYHEHCLPGELEWDVEHPTILSNHGPARVQSTATSIASSLPLRLRAAWETLAGQTLVATKYSK